MQAKRHVWVVIYERLAAPSVTLREMYWSEASAHERAERLLPYCASVFVGEVAEIDRASLLEDGASPLPRVER